MIAPSGHRKLFFPKYRGDLVGRLYAFKNVDAAITYSSYSLNAAGVGAAVILRP